MDLTILYMVAGLSSRFGGKLAHKGFEQVGINNETLIEISMNQAIIAGFNKIIFVVGNKTEKPFREKFGDSYKSIPVYYAFQDFDSKKRDRPWGTCDAVCVATDLIKEPFVIATGDDIYGKKTFEILAQHLKTSKDDAAIGINLIDMLPETNEPVNRGIFQTENNYIVEGEENLGISRENFAQRGFKKTTPVNMSIFALHPKTLQLLKEKLDKFKEQNKNSRTAECYVNVKLIELCKEKKIKMKLYPFSGKWLGITNPGDELKVREALKSI
jgi:NDP-sugar pyrophosphorylase family protein